MAPRQIRLSALRDLSLRRTASWRQPEVQRPRGELIWVHLGRPEELPALLDFAERLRDQRPGSHVLLTGCADGDRPGLHLDDIYFAELPPDHPRTVALFLKHWAPNIVIWNWGGLRPRLLDAAQQLGIPVHLVCAAGDGLERRKPRWVPDVAQTVVKRCTTLSARDRDAVLVLQELGVDADAVVHMPKLSPTPLPPHCNTQEWESFSAQVAGRPVWMAAYANEDEWSHIFAAHKQATRIIHKLLLIVDPDTQEDCDAIKAALKETGQVFTAWSSGEDLDSSTQVFIADEPGGAGLWYRLASLCFVGGSLSSAHDGRDPFPAAALGSAILHGPRISQFRSSYEKLAKAGAARRLDHPEALSTAVIRLITPELSSRMAFAGWDVVTENAQSSEAIVRLALNSLDAQTDRTSVA